MVTTTLTNYSQCAKGVRREGEKEKRFLYHVQHSDHHRFYVSLDVSISGLVRTAVPLARRVGRSGQMAFETRRSHHAHPHRRKASWPSCRY